MRQIVDAPINTIAINPYRRLHTYPYIESKIEALQRSIADVGLWPSVMARPLQDRLWKYELAFGHHRVEAARRSGVETVPLIVEDLTDEQMLQYMGRENLEDYNAVFLIQPESWEATIKSGLVPLRDGKQAQPIEIARLLGWTEQHGETPQLNRTARACHAAYALIEGGHMAHEDFAGNMNVETALSIAERTVANLEWIERNAKASRYTARENTEAKNHVVQGAKDTIEQVRGGRISRNEVRSRVDFNAGVHAARAGRPSPLFAKFARDVAKNLERTLSSDSNADKIAKIEAVLGQISLLEDWEALRRLDVELFNLAKRAEGWQKRLTPSEEKVVKFKLLENNERRSVQ